MSLRGLVIVAVAVVFGMEAHSEWSADQSNQPASFDAAAIGNPNQDRISQGARGSPVVRAQILLDRAHFSCGVIDGNFGSNLQKAVSAYQGDRNLPVTGSLDAATWASLNSDQAPPSMPYTISADDEKGPFITLPADLIKQAALPALGYTSALQELSARFHASPQLLQKLNAGADFTKTGQNLIVPNVITMPPGSAAVVSISKSESSVRANGPDGKLLAFYVATIGSEHDPLPIGNFKINGSKRDPIFHYNAKLFWDAHKPDEKAEIQPGPNNPAGSVWISLSIEHYGIHGTPDPSLVGHAFSHGCIRLTNWDALELSSMVKPSTPVILKE